MTIVAPYRSPWERFTSTVVSSTTSFLAAALIPSFALALFVYKEHLGDWDEPLAFLLAALIGSGILIGGVVFHKRGPRALWWMLRWLATYTLMLLTPILYLHVLYHYRKAALIVLVITFFIFGLPGTYLHLDQHRTVPLVHSHFLNVAAFVNKAQFLASEADTLTHLAAQHNALPVTDRLYPRVGALLTELASIYDATDAHDSTRFRAARSAYRRLTNTAPTAINSLDDYLHELVRVKLLFALSNQGADKDRMVEARRLLDALAQCALTGFTANGVQREALRVLTEASTNGRGGVLAVLATYESSDAVRHSLQDEAREIFATTLASADASSFTRDRARNNAADQFLREYWHKQKGTDPVAAIEELSTLLDHRTDLIGIAHRTSDPSVMITIAQIDCTLAYVIAGPRSPFSDAPQTALNCVEYHLGSALRMTGFALHAGVDPHFFDRTDADLGLRRLYRTDPQERPATELAAAFTAAAGRLQALMKHADESPVRSALRWKVR